MTVSPTGTRYAEAQGMGSSLWESLSSNFTSTFLFFSNIEKSITTCPYKETERTRATKATNKRFIQK
jgi:hypothetical protein